MASLELAVQRLIQKFWNDGAGTRNSGKPREAGNG